MQKRQAGGVLGDALGSVTMVPEPPVGLAWGGSGLGLDDRQPWHAQGSAVLAPGKVLVKCQPCPAVGAQECAANVVGLQAGTQ